MAKLFIRRGLAIFLLFFGMFSTFYISKNGYGFEYGEGALVFFLAYLAFIYPFYMVLFQGDKKRSVVRTVMVTNVKDLKKKLKSLESQETKELINVQAIDRRNFLIIYKG